LATNTNSTSDTLRFYSCNFSRIDNATLTVTTTGNSGTNLYVYGVNYNVLRVMSGMGGVAYSN